MTQLVFDLPHRAALGAEDFLVSGCNLAAVKLIDAWPGWQDNVQLLTVRLRAARRISCACGRRCRARRRSALTDLDIGAIDAMGEGAPLAVEDADRLPYDEKALFHLINLAREKRLFVLLTARAAPGRWNAKLPDLASRLVALPSVEIGAPDEALLRTVMLKQFTDRQLDIDPKVLEYLAVRIDRSLQAAAAAVEAVDRAALASGRKISRQLVSDALASAKVSTE